jgi:hypothetical protein
MVPRRVLPAPVSRRMLVHFRLLSAQLGIAFTALVFTVVFGRGRGFGDHTWYQFIGWWLVLALVNLHVTGTSFDARGGLMDIVMEDLQADGSEPIYRPLH